MFDRNLAFLITIGLSAALCLWVPMLDATLGRFARHRRTLRFRSELHRDLARLGLPLPAMLVVPVRKTR